jgi:site-specific DNA recombinase
MGDYFAYIRVSTQKQGEFGSSLNEQRDAITHFAEKNGIAVNEWFEETETAAKQGRGQFSQMMRHLKSRRARGVIFHKIDRGARNLKDWNDIQELIELGLDVRFAHESLDMQTRGGRLTADLLAVIASDYIRNLRDEVKKGIRGRLKQGLYPLQAPLGYLDCGGGKPKVPDPLRAPFIRQAFERYATGTVGLHALADEMYERGLRNRAGNKVTVSRLSEMLNRKFYMGIILMKGTKTTYQGIHEPIVPVSLFERVQDVLQGKLSARPLRHEFVFRKMIKCASCSYSLIGELQKGHVYYRCHTRGCPRSIIRQEAFEEALVSLFARVTLEGSEVLALLAEARVLATEWGREIEKRKQALELSKRYVTDRLSRLTDALLDGLIDKSLFEEKKEALVKERMSMQNGEEELSSLEMLSRVQHFLELAKTLKASYEFGDQAEKRQLLEKTTSNRIVRGKNPEITLRSPYYELAIREPFLFGAPLRDRPRTSRSRTALKKLLKIIVNHIATPEELGHGVHSSGFTGF